MSTDETSEELAVARAQIAALTTARDQAVAEADKFMRAFSEVFDAMEGWKAEARSAWRALNAGRDLCRAVPSDTAHHSFAQTVLAALTQDADEDTARDSERPGAPDLGEYVSPQTAQGVLAATALRVTSVDLDLDYDLDEPAADSATDSAAPANPGPTSHPEAPRA